MQKLAAELEQVEPKAKNRRFCKGFERETEVNTFGLVNWRSFELWSHCGVSEQVVANSAKRAYEKCGAADGLICSTESQAEADVESPTLNEQCISEESTECDKQAVEDGFLESELPNTRAEEGLSVCCVELTPRCEGEEANLDLDGGTQGAIEKLEASFDKETRTTQPRRKKGKGLGPRRKNLKCQDLNSGVRRGANVSTGNVAKGKAEGKAKASRIKSGKLAAKVTGQTGRAGGFKPDRCNRKGRPLIGSKTEARFCKKHWPAGRPRLHRADRKALRKKAKRPGRSQDAKLRDIPGRRARASRNQVCRGVLRVHLKRMGPSISARDSRKRTGRKRSRAYLRREKRVASIAGLGSSTPSVPDFACFPKAS
ncbi:uncharacterized protein LOC144103892 [Amblyomma americanum]